jgi:hypothetical protein
VPWASSGETSAPDARRELELFRDRRQSRCFACLKRPNSSNSSCNISLICELFTRYSVHLLKIRKVRTRTVIIDEDYQSFLQSLPLVREDV